MKTRRQEKVGIVTGGKMQKTVTVTVDRQFSHPLYKKVVRRSKKFLAHDEKSECRVGDMVRIEETRPLSRRKRWRVVSVISRGAQVAELPESAE
ncbi:MAG: 30S ribosomal protein S17 [Acidobacteria bacterium]|nr:30S ribosomal protein S17 [Acidobacteriota bacterium]